MSRLIPDDLRVRLIRNGEDPEQDHLPVLKLFDPTGAATWLLAEMLPHNHDLLFGLCDLGLGFPELGYVSLSELEGIKGRLGLGIERDVNFVARFPLSVYAEAARVSARSARASLCCSTPPLGSPRRSGALAALEIGCHHPRARGRA